MRRINKLLIVVQLISAGISYNTFANTAFMTSDADFPPRNIAKEELGKLLFFDKILSGNKNISCATCHHPITATGDGLSLSIGEGGQGLGMNRSMGIDDKAIPERVPRNAPPLFNVGALEFTHLFYDGRVAINSEHKSGFDTPAGDDLPLGLDSVLAAQALFPVGSTTEMAGQAGENSIADAATIDQLAGEQGVWQQLAQRLQAIPEYVSLFKKAFPNLKNKEDISYVNAANAIAAFEASAWRCTNSVFDKVMKNDDMSFASQSQLRGGELFYGKAKCNDCHSGAFQTDHQFHAIALPQIGAGKGDGEDGHDDLVENK